MVLNFLEDPSKGNITYDNGYNKYIMELVNEFICLVAVSGVVSDRLN